MKKILNQKLQRSKYDRWMKYMRTICRGEDNVQMVSAECNQFPKTERETGLHLMSTSPPKQFSNVVGRLSGRVFGD